MPVLWRRLILLASVFTAFAAGQVREKRVAPVPASSSAVFDRQSRIAIVAGISAYSEASGLSALQYADADASAVAEELKKQGYSVRMLLNSDASRGAIRRVLNDLPKIIDPDQGTLLFYFSGHGFAQSGVNYLATFGAGADDIADEGLSIPEVERLLKAAKPKRQILLIDACRNETAAGVRGASGRSFAALQDSAGLRQLYSTRPGTFSYEDAKLKHGVFTYFLLQGLDGAAAGTDGLITFRDLADYATARMRDYSVTSGHVQIPRESGEAEGDFVLARLGTPAAPVEAGVAAPKGIAAVDVKALGERMDYAVSARKALAQRYPQGDRDPRTASEFTEAKNALAKELRRRALESVKAQATARRVPLVLDQANTLWVAPGIDLANTAATGGPVSIGVVNLQKALGETEELKRAQAEMTAKYKPREDAIAQLGADLESIQRQLSSGTLSATASADLQTQGMRKQRDRQRMSDDLQQDVQRDKDEIEGKAMAKMRGYIAELARQAGLDAVVDATDLLYNSSAADLTVEALNSYNRGAASIPPGRRPGGFGRTVAALDTQKAIAETDELKKAAADMEAKNKPRQDQLAKLRSDLDSITTELSSGKLTQQAIGDLVIQGQRKERDRQRLSEDLQQDMDRDRQEVLGRAAQRMQQTIAKLAEARGYNVIFDVSQIAYVEPGLDLTSDAVAAYNKAYPAGSGR